MVGLIIVTVMGITVLTTTAVNAKVTFHKEIHTTEFVRNWHQHFAELWTQENQIDNEIVNEIVNLRQALLLLGDQLETLMEQIKVKCDWNVTTFCIITLKVNESKYNWEKVKFF